jgi:hypothetical protein
MSGSRNSRHRRRTPTASPKPATIRPDLRRARSLVIADTNIYGGDGVPRHACPGPCDRRTRRARRQASRTHRKLSPPHDGDDPADAGLTAAYPLRGSKRKLPWRDQQPVCLDLRKLATTVMYRHSKENWVPDLMKGRPDVSMETIEKYLHNLYAVQPDFLYSVSRDFIRNCRTPMLVLPDDVPGHPLQTSIDVASLAPNAKITVYPWKEPEELRQRTIDRARRFSQAHIPMRAAAQ